MVEFTEMTIYMVKYQCVKKDVVIDEYPVGYFVSKQEALAFVLNDISECENPRMERSDFRIIGFDGDPDYKHVYLLRKVNVGKPAPENDITSITRWE